jgi:hypothetical protein
MVQWSSYAGSNLMELMMDNESLQLECTANSQLTNQHRTHQHYSNNHNLIGD